MYLLAIVLVLLGIIAITPPFLVALGDLHGPFLTRLEYFISSNDGLLTSLGTIFLISALSLVGIHLANRSQEVREAANRKANAEIAIAGFREKWIDELRKELSDIARLTFHYEGAEGAGELIGLISRVQMRLNHNEALADDLRKAMLNISQLTASKSKSERAEAHKQFVKSANAYLKHEWSRLKSDIKKSLILDVDEI